MSTVTLVQPLARRREWELRRGGEVRGLLRIPTFRSGAHAEAAGRPLTIERHGRLRAEYIVRDELTGEEAARLHRNVLELDGKTLEWKGSRFVDESGEPLLTAKVKSGLVRSSGEVTVDATVPEPEALVMALLAAYLLIRRNEAAAAGATAAVTTTSV
jgi:hypothetical protein